VTTKRVFKDFHQNPTTILPLSA